MRARTADRLANGTRKPVRERVKRHADERRADWKHVLELRQVWVDAEERALACQTKDAFDVAENAIRPAYDAWQAAGRRFEKGQRP